MTETGELSWDGHYLQTVASSLQSGVVTRTNEYDSFGKLASVHYRSGSKSLFSFTQHHNIANATVSEFVSQRDRPLSWRGFEYDPATRLARVMTKSGTDPPALTRPFTRAAEVSNHANAINATTSVYERNAIGSATKITNGSSIESQISYAGSGKVSSFTRQGSNLPIEYDPTGRVKRIDQWSYQYDPFGQLASEVGNSSSTDFYYRDDGVLAGTRNGNVVTQFLSDDDQIVAAYNSAGRLWDITWGVGLDQPAIFSSSTGSVALISDSRGTVVSTGPDAFGYRAFDENGSVQTTTCSSGTCSALRELPVHFAGLLSPGKSGLLYARNRWYSPELGRFTSIDPLGLVDGMDVYAYAGMNPIDFRDPWGLKKKKGLFGQVKGFAAAVADLFRHRSFEERLGPLTGNGKFTLTQRDQERLVESIKGAKPIGYAIGKGAELAAGGELLLGAKIVRSGLTLARAGVNAAPSLAKGAVNLAKSAPERAKKGLQAVKNTVKRIANRCKGSSCSGDVCFVAGTEVVTADGSKPIEQIEVGDVVLSGDELTGKLEYKPVTQTFVSPPSRVLNLTTESPNGKTEQLGVTPEHPFWVRSRGWVQAGGVRVGEQLFTASSGWLRVTGSTWAKESAVVYNFEVKDFHTYFVGDAAVWVHNSCYDAARGAGLLARSEAAGGHLIARHVGQSTQQLAARLAGNARLPAASTFNSVAQAEGAVASALRANASQVSTWVAAGARGRLVVNAPFSGGSVLVRGASSPVPGTGVRAVLQGNGSGGYHVLTGFPVP